MNIFVISVLIVMLLALFSEAHYKLAGLVEQSGDVIRL
jgi:hypothetical protein